MDAKRLIFIVLLLSLCVRPSLHASPVSERQARDRAAAFFASTGVATKAQASGLKLVATYPEAVTKAESSPSMYVFERESGGYALVAGDDVARPILGYSLSGRFPVREMPDGLKALLQWYSDVIGLARKEGWTSQAVYPSDVLNPANTVKLNTVQWSQYSPFNDLVAAIDGEKPPIGCTATAIAIIMRYHKWPQRGTGTLPSYSYEEEGKLFTIDGITLGHEYDWNKMPDNFSQCSAEEAAQIARLLYDVAVMCRMAFYPGGSGALTNSALRLAEYFGYDKSMCYYNRSDGHTDEVWEQMVIDEIVARRPVLYSGFTGEGGHALVIDGFNGRYFSFNFGWGGGVYANEGRSMPDEFRTFFTLTPIEGHEADLIHYNRAQELECRIMPDQGGEPEMNLATYSGSGIPWNFARGEEFSLSQGVTNKSLAAGQVALCFALYDKNGRYKETVSEVSEYYLPSDGYKWLSSVRCKVEGPLEDGDRIDLSAKDASGQWKPLTTTRQGDIILTDRPIADCVEVGHVEGELDFYLKIYKDMPWGIFREGEAEPLLSSRSYSDQRWDGHYRQQVKMNETGDEPMVYIWLPSGTYLLKMSNPVSGERMEVTLEL